MKSKFIIIVFVTAVLFFPKYGFGLEDQYKEVVEHFVTSVRNNDKTELAKLIQFPLGREHPLSSIKTADEFLQRFDEVFDKKLIEIISNSDINKDWNDVGWRGIMLKNGILWLDYDGKVKSINYESKVEKRKRIALINAEKNNLHSSLQKFLEPVVEWKTKTYRIRIDHLGRDKYRYAVWPVNKLPSEKPDLVLTNGELILDGSGGNHHYDFKHGIYKYTCYVTIIGTDETPPGVLGVYKNGNLILREPVIEVINK